MSDTNPTPTAPRHPEYVKLPADDFRELTAAAYEPRDPATPGQRVGRTAETAAGFAAFGLLVAGVGWAGTKAVNFLEEQRLQRQLKKTAAEKAAKENTGPTPSA